MAERTELIWTREAIARFWEYERGRPENFFSFQHGAVIARKFRKFFPDNASTVDYGAGSGFLVDDLLANGMRCAAVEFGTAAVSELTRRFHNHPSFLGAQTPEHLDDWREKFAGAFLVEVIEHLYDTELLTTLSSVRKLLQPGGTLIVTTPNEEDRSKSFICSPESGKLFHRFQHVRSWSAAALRSMLEDHGFSRIDTGTTDFGASLLARRRTMSLPVRIARACAKQLLHKRPHLYAVARRTS